jgi:uncharacterized protein (UPF0261 family)
MISQTDIAVCTLGARQCLAKSATRNAMPRALHELLKPRPAVGRFIVVGGEAAARCKLSTMTIRPAS